MSYIYKLKQEYKAIFDRVSDLIYELILDMCKYYKVPEPRVRIRSTKSAYYIIRSKEIFVNFNSILDTILHEVHHHIHYHKDTTISTSEISFEEEFLTSSWIVKEYSVWIERYTKEIFPLQIKMYEIKDKLKFDFRSK